MMCRLRQLGILLMVSLLTACSSVPDKSGESEFPEVGGVSIAPEGSIQRGEMIFTPVEFEALPITMPMDWEVALTAFKQSCQKMQTKALWKNVCQNAQYVPSGLAYSYFRSWFSAWSVSIQEKETIKNTGLTTGYYEPFLKASLYRHGPFQTPIYSLPKDLIQVQGGEFSSKYAGVHLRGKIEGQKLVPYDTRAIITERQDLLRNHVICWAEDPVEVFFLQIQGSGRIQLDNGQELRLNFADHNGHPYRSVSRWLVENTDLTYSQMSMQAIKKWAKNNPKRRKEMLNSNPRFVFFQARKPTHPNEGPIGAQGIPLTERASVAVDRKYWPMGLPFVIDVSQSDPAMHFARPVVAQDTGSAIQGPIRFDFFWGAGEAAGQMAGQQKSETRAWILLPAHSTPMDLP